MTKSTLILLCIAFTISIAILTLAASAQCSSCMKEGDWGESAKNFIEGKPIDDTPQLFGPKAERQKNSELASDSGKAQESANNTSNAAPINAPGSWYQSLKHQCEAKFCELWKPGRDHCSLPGKEPESTR